MLVTTKVAIIFCLLTAASPPSAEAGIIGVLGEAVEYSWKRLADQFHPPPHVHGPPASEAPADAFVSKESAKPVDFPNPYNYGEPLTPAVHALPSALRSLPHQSRAREDLSWKIATALGAPPRLIFAHSSAKAFGKEFSRGAYNGEKYLGELGKTNPIVASWLDAPASRRVFVVGAADSDSDVKELRDRLKALGYQVFFYKFCEGAIGKLCSSEEVGAFYGTAGHAVAFRTRDFYKSPYIDIEVATIYKHSKGGMVLVFTPRDALWAGLLTGTTAVAATCFDLAPSMERRTGPNSTIAQMPSKASYTATSPRRKGGCSKSQSGIQAKTN